MTLLLQQLQSDTVTRFWLTPFTPVAEKLSRDLLAAGVNIAGYIDKQKQGSNITTPEALELARDERILILSPNHALDIYLTLRKKGIKPGQLILLRSRLPYQTVSYRRLWLEQALARFKPACLRRLQHVLRGRWQDSRTVLLLGKDFVDLNIKDVYISLSQTADLQPVIATDNTVQRQQLRSAGFNVISLHSWYFLWYCLRARVKVLDHSPVNAELLYALLYSRTVQIWHGIPLKKIGHLVNYKMVHYDLVVSTSPFVTEYAFAELFSTTQFVECGYPRNDVLTCGVNDRRQLALVNQPIYQWLAQHNRSLVVYMPTWRDDSLSANPIELEALNQFAKAQELTIVIKMHPFIRPEAFFDTLDTGKYRFTADYSENIVFYPSTDDIYPLLSRSVMLITDYSSVYFDYLLVDKPILFFVYDLARYIEKQGDFMLAFDDFTPGDKAFNFAELIQMLLQNLQQDNWQHSRQQLRDRLFSHADGTSAARLSGHIAGLMQFSSPVLPPTAQP